MAYMLKSEFKEVDMDRVVNMCLSHDLGECFTGDIPTFDKTDMDRETEDFLLKNWVKSLPEELGTDMSDLYKEMEAQETKEAKLYKALDKLEALISHNESDISTWLPLEYDLQLTYGRENMQFSEYLKELRASVDEWTHTKIREEAPDRRAAFRADQIL